MQNQWNATQPDSPESFTPSASKKIKTCNVWLQCWNSSIQLKVMLNKKLHEFIPNERTRETTSGYSVLCQCKLWIEFYRIISFCMLRLELKSWREELCENSCVVTTQHTADCSWHPVISSNQSTLTTSNTLLMILASFIVLILFANNLNDIFLIIHY